jgi:hypothetical protein
LPNRPREIVEILVDRGHAPEFSPAVEPTAAFPVIDRPYLAETGPAAIREYTVLRTFRPWWISQAALDPQQRPVAIGPAVLLLMALATGGLGLLLAGGRSLTAPQIAQLSVVGRFS